jgi:hypothetical protein
MCPANNGGQNVTSRPVPFAKLGLIIINGQELPSDRKPRQTFTSVNLPTLRTRRGDMSHTLKMENCREPCWPIFMPGRQQTKLLSQNEGQFDDMIYVRVVCGSYNSFSGEPYHGKVFVGFF